MKRLVLLALAFVLAAGSLGSGLLTRAAGGGGKEWTYVEVITQQVDAHYEWSGTWTVQGTEGTNNPGTNAFDGMENNKWGSFDICQSGEEWLAVHFGETVRIADWTLYQDDGAPYTNIRKYAVQIKRTENAAWETVYTSGTLESYWRTDHVDLPEAIECTSWRFYVQGDWAEPGRLQADTPNSYAVELSEVYLNGYLYRDAGTVQDSIVADPEVLRAMEAISVQEESCRLTPADVDTAFYMLDMFNLVDSEALTYALVQTDGKDAYFDVDASTFLDLHTFYDSLMSGAYSFSVKMRAFAEDNDQFGIFARTIPASAMTNTRDEIVMSSYPLFEWDYYLEYSGAEQGVVSTIGAAGVIVTPFFSNNKVMFKITVKRNVEDGLYIASSSCYISQLNMLQELQASLSPDAFFTVRFLDNGKDRTYILVNGFLLCYVEYSGEPVAYDNDGDNGEYTYWPSAAVKTADGSTLLEVSDTYVAANQWICGIGSRMNHIQVSDIAIGQGSGTAENPGTTEAPAATDEPASQTPAHTQEAGAPTDSAAASSPTAGADQKRDPQSGKGLSTGGVIGIVVAAVAVVAVAVAVVIVLTVRKKKGGNQR